MNYQGKPCSPSQVISGKCEYLPWEELKNIDCLDDNIILLTDMCFISMLKHFRQVKGVVTCSSSIGGHTNIICREEGIPVVIGLDEEDLKSLDGKYIHVNVYSGKVWTRQTE